MKTVLFITNAQESMIAEFEIQTGIMHDFKIQACVISENGTKIKSIPNC